MSKRNVVAGLVVAACLGVATSGVQAQSKGAAQAFGQIGSGDHGYANDGFGVKLGVDFGRDVNGVKNLGLTAFYVHTDGDDHWGNNRWSYETDTFAFGPTYTHAVTGSSWALQARAYLELDRIRWGVPCCRGSDTEINIGLGVGAQYALDSKMSVRLDYDLLGSSVDLLTVGLGYRF